MEKVYLITWQDENGTDVVIPYVYRVASEAISGAAELGKLSYVVSVRINVLTLF